MLKTSCILQTVFSTSLSLGHPFVFLFAFLFYVYSRTHVITSPHQLIRPFVFYSILIFLLSCVANWILRDLDLTGLSLTVFVLGVCATLNFLMFVMKSFGTVLVVWGAYSYFRKRKMMFSEISLLLSITALGIAVVFSASPVAAIKKSFQTNRSLDGWNNISEFANLSPTSTSMPDIYYIVLDGYVRSDVLKELFSYDNSDFLQSLEDKGFIIPNESRSNYPKTAVSVPSTLNMDYIASILPEQQNEYYWWLVEPLIDHSRTMKGLEHLGYKSVSIMTDWGITDNPETDVYYTLQPFVLSDYENVLLQVTPLGMVTKPLLAKFAFFQSNQNHYKLLLYQFDTLENIPELDGPKFVFAHIIAPHPPFIVDGNGKFNSTGYSFNFNDASDYPLGRDEYRKGYTGQVQFINKQIERVVDSILEKSKSPPIIIIQADHGSGLFTDLNSPDATCLKERFSIFAAYYLPGMDRKVIPDDITPVNIFRIVFNQYFEANLSMLDRAHYFPGLINIYNSQDVTLQVDSCTTR